MAITADYQFELRGLLLGDGTDYEVTKVQGLDMPDVRARTLDPYRHGLVGVGDHWFGAREVIIDLDVLGTPGADLANKLRDLATATQPSSSDLVMSYRLEGESTRRINVRPIGRTYPVDVAATRGFVPVALRFVAYDPRLYADAETSTPITIASGAVNGSATITNAGTFETLPVMTMTGGVPTTSLSMTNLADSSRVVKVLTTGLATADILVVNFAKRTVTVNGVNRYDLVDATTRWWRLLPAGNIVSVSRPTGDAYGSTFTFTHRDAWV